MHANTGEIKKVPDGKMTEIEKAFSVEANKVRKARAAGEDAAMAPSTVVPVPTAQIKKVRKMNKERRKAWAKTEFERRVRRKRQRKARKA
ncbi:hypothetical protein LCGC14_3077950, partial [marine sediment metagenome]